MRIAILTLTLLFSSFLTAQTDVELSEAVVSENRIQVPLSEKAASVTILKKKDLTEMPGISLADKLHQVNGLDLRSRGPHGIQTDLGLRGSTFDQVLVLINGIRLNDAQTGHHVLNLPIDIESIERVEVHYGSAARVFGQGTYAGAINIITTKSTEDYLKLKIAAGENELFSAGLSANLASDNSSQYFSAEINSSDGYKYNTDYEIINLFYNSVLESNAGEINFMAGYTSRKFGANGFYASPDFQDQYEEIKTTLAALSFSPKLNNSKVRLNTKFYWRNNNDDYVFLRQDPAFFNNVHTNNQLGAEAHFTAESSFGLTGFGAEYQHVNLESNNLGERSRDVVSVFLEHKLSLMEGKLSLTPGVQFNSFSDFGENILLGVDLAYYLNDYSKVYFNAGQTFRIPTYTDLFYQDPANSSNPDLVPELAFSQDLGYKTQIKKNIELELVAFRRESDNLIDRVKENEDEPWVPENISSLTTQGASLNINMRNAEFLPEFISNFNLGYTYLTSDFKVDEGTTSRFNLEILNHQLTTGITFKYAKNLTHNFSFRYADRANLASFSVLGSQLNYSLKNGIGINVSATNILDEEYKETNLVTMPGRWIVAGVSYKIK